MGKRPDAPRTRMARPRRGGPLRAPAASAALADAPASASAHLLADRLAAEPSE